jgi:hypothetical protein
VICVIGFFYLLRILREDKEKNQIKDKELLDFDTNLSEKRPSFIGFFKGRKRNEK